jgi:hypothetical protein
MKDQSFYNCSYEMELRIVEDYQGNMVKMEATAKNLKLVKEFEDIFVDFVDDTPRYFNRNEFVVVIGSANCLCVYNDVKKSWRILK